MIIRCIIPFLLIFFIVNFGFSQTEESLKQRKESLKLDLEEWDLDIKEALEEVDKIKKELKFLEDSLKVYPIWSKGVFGTVGFNFSRFQSWLSKNESNTSASTFGYSFNGFFNLEEKKYFWNNTLKLAQSWQRFINKDNEAENDGFQVSADAFTYNSIWGYKTSENLAISALVEYKTGLLQKRFNNPGTLDVGFGMTWKPLKEMLVAVHPINYNSVLAEENARSSLGIKTIVEYSRKFSSGINWTTSFSGFVSYRNNEFNNWSWTNGLGKTIKGIGIGLDVSFKQSRREAVVRELDNNPVQWYYCLLYTSPSPRDQRGSRMPSSA